MDKPWGRYAKWNKPLTKGYPIRSLLHAVSQVAEFVGTNGEKSDFQGPGAGRRKGQGQLLLKVREFSFAR